MFRTAMQKEQIATASRMLDSVFNEFLDRPRLVRAFNLLGAGAERESSLLLLDTDVTNAAVELDCQ